MTTPLPPRFSGQEPVVEQGRGGWIPTRRYTQYFATTQHWTVQTSVLNGAVQAQMSDLSYRIGDASSLSLQAQAEVAALKGDPRLESATRALELATTALIQGLSKQDAHFRQEIGELYRLFGALSQQVAQTQQQQVAMARDADQDRADTDALKGFIQHPVSQAAEIASRQATLEQEVSNLTTDQVIEGANLYYTDGRADARVVAGLAAADTDDIDEGSTNKYFTDTRADARIVAAVGVSVQAYDADLTAFAGKTAPAGAVVGTTDSQSLSNKTFDQLRTSQTATAAAVAQSHHVAVEIGGVPYKLLLGT